MEGPRPSLEAGQVLVQVAASTVNITDYLRFTAKTDGGTPLWVRALDGALGATGRPLGCEVAGTVALVGPGVDGLAVGDQVFASVGLRGGWAEYALAGAGRACRKPAGLSWAQAAALPVAGSTARTPSRTRPRPSATSPPNTPEAKSPLCQQGQSGTPDRTPPRGRVRNCPPRGLLGFYPAGLDVVAYVDTPNGIGNALAPAVRYSAKWMP
jgi:hypothetical protein